MARGDEGLPPPVTRGKKKPDMAGEDPSIYGKLAQLAGGGQGAGSGMQGQPGQGGQPGMGGGDPSSLIQNGVSQLVEAAQADPRLQGVIQQVVQILKEGIGGMAGGGGEEGGMEQPPSQDGKKKKGKRRVEPPPAEESSMGQESYNY